MIDMKSMYLRGLVTKTRELSAEDKAEEAPAGCPPPLRRLEGISDKKEGDTGFASFEKERTQFCNPSIADAE